MVLSSRKVRPRSSSPAASRSLPLLSQQEDEAAFSLGQSQRSFDERNQDFVEHACGIKLASSFQK